MAMSENTVVSIVAPDLSERSIVTAMSGSFMKKRTILGIPSRGNERQINEVIILLSISKLDDVQIFMQLMIILHTASYMFNLKILL